MKGKLNIYEFTDYREYLAAYYADMKQVNPRFSYRYFSQLAGFAAPNFMKMVVDGKRNVGPQSVAQIARAIGLSAQAHHFFCAMVDFAQADSRDAKEEAFGRIASSKQFRSARKIDGPLFEYLTHWYYPAVRELTARPDFREEPHWIASRVVPAITAKEAGRALATLRRLELVVEDPSGRLILGDPTLDAGHEVQALAARPFHRQMLERAAASIELIPKENRDLSAMTVCIKADQVAEVKRRLVAFRESIMAYCDAEVEGHQVFQLNMQFFPLSTSMEDEE